MKRAATLGILMLAMLITSTSSATILETGVYTHAKLSYLTDGSFVTYDEINDLGVQDSSSVVYDSLTGAGVSSELSIQDLTSESATLNFEILFNSPTDSPTEYVVAADREFYKLNANLQTKATFTYLADEDSLLNVAWDFSYAGINPFGLQNIRLRTADDLWTPWLDVGNYGILGEHIGDQNFDLLAGEEYFFEIYFYPNYQGYQFMDSSLSGSFSLDFQSGDDVPAPVPEPSTVLLLGGGLAGLAFYRRKRK